MEEIIKKLDALDAKVEKDFAKINQRLDEHDKRFDEHASQIDLLALTVADHTERLERIEDKLGGLAGIDAKLDKVINVLDDMVGLVKKHDEEIVMINHNHRKLDRRVEVLEQKV